MKIEKMHLYHGAALTQIVEHESFKALNRASLKYGHYLVNADCEVFVKYRTGSSSSWQFIFSAPEVKAIRSEIQSRVEKVWVALVCGDVSIALLNGHELAAVLDFTNGSTQQSINVQAPSGKSMRVSGPLGSLPKTVPHNRFPNALFAS